MAGKKKKTRSEVFANYFANSAWRSADEAKRLRTRSRAAASTCKEVLGITNHLNDGDRAIIAEDITALKRAFEILDQMGNAFELAQRTAKQAEVKRDSDRLQAEEARLDDMVVELFGKNPKKLEAVSYTHLTLPTICSVQISVVAVSLKKKKKQVMAHGEASSARPSRLCDL
eukprot:TRINITY_DN1907_c0_g1_i3.p4 TRINITY_DN1907_c0_g1~~TRINITY_DN1907_c0_g1_i3.p4  ORF type:complete len:172 (-),score=9.52 TRINITY_DN1907_c0_g1_i3:57-572(-)